MNEHRFPWVRPGAHEYQAQSGGIYSCRTSKEVGDHVMRLMHRVMDMAPSHPMLPAMEHDLAELYWRGQMLQQAEVSERRLGLCSCMDWNCGLLTEEAK